MPALPPILAPIARCPRCRSALVTAEPQTDARAWLCGDADCAYATAGFPAANDTPVLVDFENSVVSREAALKMPASSAARQPLRDTKRKLLGRLFNSAGPTTENARRFLDHVHGLSQRPVVLIVGGATVGFGAEPLYEDPSVKLIGADIYRTDITDLMADGHQLPLADKSVDGVWIQAVLEHVLDPQHVAQEIHRVLRDRGVVYAETPFMQQVHMGRYDFTRFTLTGHRWLFRGFKEISSGVTRGPGTSMLWSIRYFFSALFGSYKAGTLATLPFFWVRFFDRFANAAYAEDGANGVYFFGQRSNRAIGPKEVLAHYHGAL